MFMPALAVRAQSDAPTFVLRPGWRLVQIPIRSGDWSVAVAAAADSPASTLLIAHRTPSGWRVLAADSAPLAEFDAWLDALPADLLSMEDRIWFRLNAAESARNATAAVAGFHLPVAGGWTALMTQGPLGPFSHRTSWAIDMVLPDWGTYTSTVVAAKSGVVMYVKDVSTVGGLGTGFSGYANGVVIRHGPGEYSWYWHLAQGSVPTDVQPGTLVEAGTVIGWMGSTGYSSGPHLHFQISSSFRWPGCDSEFGCPSRETNVDRAPWSSDTQPIDFEETDNESSWIGCDAPDICGDLPPSANRLAATDGPVAYWARDYDGPGWKMRAPFSGDLPAWLAGRARSLALPAGWWATLYDQPGLQGSSVIVSDSRPLLFMQPWSLSAAPGAAPLGRQVTKRLRSDLAAAWPYLLGSADGHASALQIDGHAIALGACGWAVEVLEPGAHDVVFTLSPSAPPLATLTAQRWPFAVPACVALPADPGPSPGESPCVDVPDEAEPNDAAELAAPLRAGAAQMQRVAAPGDADWAVFTTTAGSWYALFTDALESATDTVLELVAGDGITVLARNDDIEGVAGASRILWRAGQDGTLYARVRQWDPGMSGCDTGYRLRLIEMRPRVWAPMMSHSISFPVSSP